MKMLYFLLSKVAEVYPIGKFKWAPGTFASFIALFLGYYLLILFGIKLFIIIIICIFFLGIITSEIHIKIYKKKDPKEIVIDEFTGQFISLLAIPTTTNENELFIYLLLSFLLFRFFDITKIGPIKKFEKLPGGWGIMIDDVIAGIVSFIIQCGIWTSFNKDLLITYF